MTPIKVGVTEKNQNPYWDMVNAGWRDAAGRLDLELEIAAPPAEAVDAQVATMRRQLDAGAQALAFVATRVDAFDDVIAEATDRGVPVVAFDLDAPASGRALFVGMEPPHEAGRRVGRQLAQLVGDGATVIVQTGSDHAPGATGKRAGFGDVMAEHGITIVEGPSDGENAATALATAETLLAGHPEATGMFGVYGYHPIVQARAVKNLGRTGDVVVAGFDLLPETVDLVEAGEVAATTWIQEYYFGFYAAAAISDLVRLGTTEALTIRGMSPARLKDNVFVPEPITYTRDTIGRFREWSERSGVRRRTAATTI